MLLLISRSVVTDCWWPHGPQHARFPCTSPSSGVCSNSHPLSQWCHTTISSFSVIPFYSCLQSFPAQGLYLSQFFPSGGQSFSFSISPSSEHPGLISFRIDCVAKVSASASVLPVNIQDWFPLGLTSWISLQFKGLSRVFSNTTVQKHQFFSAQLSL